jgi:dihydroorotate dehydrogenase
MNKLSSIILALIIKGIDHGINQIKKFNRNIPIGINIGKNATTDIKDAFRDYEYCLRKSYSVADYITLNISSPNYKKFEGSTISK